MPNHRAATCAQSKRARFSRRRRPASVPTGSGGSQGRSPTSSDEAGRRSSSAEAPPSCREEPGRSRQGIPGARLVLREVGRESLRVALLLDAIDKRVERDAALLVAGAATPQGHGAGRSLLVPDDEHVARLPLLRFLDAVAQVPGLLVDVHAEIVRTQLLRDVARVVEGRFADRDDRDLLPVEPQREIPRVVLDEAPDEALETPEENAVDHHRALTLALLVHERDVEALGQVEVDLDRRTLPLAPDRVVDLDVDLRRIEDTAALVELVRDVACAERRPQRLFGLVPELVGPEPLLGTRREIDRWVRVAEDAQELEREIEDFPDLVLRLLPRAEDVRVVLCETADAEHPVKRAPTLVPIDGAELADAQRKVAVRVDLRLKDLDVARAVHRLDPESLRALV